MKNIKADVVIIGAGTAGLNAFRSTLEHTDNVVLIEGGAYGTMCARVGCMPSKLLIAAADSAHSVREAHNFGVYTRLDTEINGSEVMKRVRSERDRFVGFVLDSVDNIDPKQKIKGYARFKDDNTIQVDDHSVIKCRSVVIATGSVPHVPESLVGLGDSVVVNDDVFEWQDLPKSVAVFGTGVVGLEIGQALSRLGVDTTLFGRSGIIGHLRDPDIQRYALKIFSDELDIHLESDISQIEKEGDEVKITYRDNHGNKLDRKVDYILAATGRVPNVEELGLHNTSIKLDNEGIPYFDRYTLQCGRSSIFIAGDVDNDLPLLHQAADEGKIAGENAARYPDVKAGCRSVPLSIIFSDPEIAMVGNCFDELPEGSYVIGEVSFENQGRSRVMLKNKGLMHLYAEYGSGLFMGAEIVGPRAEHMGHLLSWAFQKKMTVPEMLTMPFYHPVIEEGIRTALRDALNKLKMGPPLDLSNIECGPGV